jgi:hypothetical protein
VVRGFLNIYPDELAVLCAKPSFRLRDFPGVDPKSTVRPEGTRSHESFSLVSPYSSVSKPRGDYPVKMGKGILVPGKKRTQNLHCFSVGG